ncbi:hypothetical protein [Halalkalicoccus jeotgali]|uniref:Uncharacterized protein n=1 Tax=Halalkalicoccus jeotgali (strain DSM 18796 / CECT 7217 / JCM 14584 / KCTC 4019 / B3) TaxID=795797 RepID=D8J9W7_HALJB|nr:hypothetical protein [Halalkalicoccus jeotgali]ADJ14489.1 hypothetical protein HacjB3_05490 [Halalkalicoccus jeotgali B3]ELY40203.1 hypothetical protein C497_03865 [Halalkalicoccus jeotgali B3]
MSEETHTVTDYDPGPFERFPHIQYRCQCGASTIVIGWEIEAVVCDRCSEFMEHGTDLYHPRFSTP